MPTIKRHKLRGSGAQSLKRMSDFQFSMPLWRNIMLAPLQFPFWILRLFIARRYIIGFCSLLAIGIFYSDIRAHISVNHFFANRLYQIGFRLEDIRIEQRNRTALSDLYKVLQNETDLVTLKEGRWHINDQMPIFLIDLEEIKIAVEQLPWVARADIRRNLPNIIFIRLYEHEPFAFYSDGNSLSLVNRGGEVITENHLGMFKGLPVISGKGSLRHAPVLLDLMSRYGHVRPHLIAAHWAEQRYWALRFNNNVRVMLPSTSAEIENAFTLLEIYQKETRLLSDSGNTRIDLRLKNPVVRRQNTTPPPINFLDKKDDNL